MLLLGFSSFSAQKYEKEINFRIFMICKIQQSVALKVLTLHMRRREQNVHKMIRILAEETKERNQTR